MEWWGDGGMGGGEWWRDGDGGMVHGFGFMVQGSPTTAVKPSKRLKWLKVGSCGMADGVWFTVQRSWFRVEQPQTETAVPPGHNAGFNEKTRGPEKDSG